MRLACTDSPSPVAGPGPKEGQGHVQQEDVTSHRQVMTLAAPGNSSRCRDSLHAPEELACLSKRCSTSQASGLTKDVEEGQVVSLQARVHAGLPGAPTVCGGQQAAAPVQEVAHQQAEPLAADP